MPTPERPDDKSDSPLTPLLEPAAGADWIVLGYMGVFAVAMVLFVGYCWLKARHGGG